MREQEGVIKYQFLHTEKTLSSNISTDQLNAWRHILFRLNLIGQRPDRYDGYGFGNISQRINHEQFIVSGTQTGHLAMLEPQHFAIVEQASPELNRLRSHGCSKPSSEALTHAILYQLDKNIGAVIHVHCPEIWRNTVALDLPFTAEEIAYGTVEMTLEIKRLFASARLTQTGMFSMLGHVDGVVVFANNLMVAATLVIRQLSRAIAIELNR